jgi:hypothetical protein
MQRFLLPADVLTHIGSWDFHNGPVIPFRILGTPLQRVDAPEPDRQFFRPSFAQLVNGLGKALGDLSFLGGVLSLRGEKEAHEDEQTTCNLDQRVSRVGLQLDDIFGVVQLP